MSFGASEPIRRPRRPGGILLRLFAALTVLLFALAPLGRAVHLLSVQHGYCAAHGELIHLTGDGSFHASHGDDAQIPVIGSPSTDEEDAHEPCAVLGALHRTPAIVERSEAIVSSPELAPRLSVETGAPDPIRARLILLLAPKASPPV